MNYSPANLRQFIVDAFSDEEIRQLCFEHLERHFEWVTYLPKKILDLTPASRKLAIETPVAWEGRLFAKVLLDSLSSNLNAEIIEEIETGITQLNSNLEEKIPRLESGAFENPIRIQQTFTFQIPQSVVEELSVEMRKLANSYGLKFDGFEKQSS
ncbi:MAG: hypothetical protein HC853_06405 [Anaerolineae bacterium]|nr:hypothetical protein [Anaerolineae bacterium]